MVDVEWSFGSLAEIGPAMERKAEALSSELAYAFDAIGARWKSAMVGSINGPLSLRGPKGRDEPLATRTKALRSSFFAKTTRGSIDELSLALGNSARYSKTHEFGTVGAGGEMPDIVPVRARALTIPLEDAMTPSGVPKEPSARSWPDTFLWFGEDDNPDRAGFIVREDPSEPGELEFLYMLAKRVAIPPRLGMRRTFAEQEAERTKEVALAIGRAMAT